MAYAIVTVKIMPESPDSDISNIEKEALAIVRSSNDNKETKVAIEPIAFGLNAVNITFVIDEKKGSPDPIAETIAKLPNVLSAEITDVRRAIG
jgi:translation elongation factor aEF-1 beta